MDYKNTVNLPQTNFPMQGKLPQREPKTLEHWQGMELYQQLRQQNQGKPKYILHDGPPYANGKIHIGHAVNKVLKDVINKSRLLMGYDVPYVPGWDCHGLPIELNVEKKLGKVGDKVDAETFRQACRKYAAEQVDGQKSDFVRLGILGDWANPYLTMDFHFEANIVRELGRLAQKQVLYRGAKPVHWCMDCKSALAEAEVEYQDRIDPAIDVAFAVADIADLQARLALHATPGSVIPGDLHAVVAIWTTTPWTLPANRAVAVHPEYEYVLLLNGEGRALILAGELMNDALKRYGWEHVDILARFPGAKLEGLVLQHPFLDRTSPVILGEHVTLDSGTGAVHTAPGHGQDDYQVGLKYQLEIANPVNDRGVFKEDTEYFAGEHVFKANPKIVGLLGDKGALLHLEEYPHSYPHCWRHKTPLIFRATPQWFIGMERQHLRAHALTEIEQTQWLPEWGEARIHSMVANRPDWCISRQRSWGAPVALLVCADCGQPLRSEEGFENIAKAVEESGIDIWFTKEVEDFLPTGAECEHCGSRSFEKVNDVLDVWFDSGVTHACVLEQREELHSPADLYLEGSDQHRGWFQSSLLESVASRGRAPYKAVLTHGFAVDGEGRKMSKSLGNVIAPQTVIDKWGADILRLWVASEDYRGEIRLSDEILKRQGEHYRRIRNTARYFLGNLHDFKPEADALPLSEMVELDRWVLAMAHDVHQIVVESYQAFSFHKVMQRVHHFCSVDLGGFYLDVLKDRLYTTKPDSRPRRSAQTALYHLLEAMTRWVAPVLSFTAEEIWLARPYGGKPGSVFGEEFHVLPEMDGAALLTAWEPLLQLRASVSLALENLRKTGEIGGSQQADLTLYLDDAWRGRIGTRADELRFFFLTSNVTLAPLTDRGELAEALPGVAILVAKCEFKKCVRCWHQREDVGSHSEHPELCGRCVENIVGEGEVRAHI